MNVLIDINLVNRISSIWVENQMAVNTQYANIVTPQQTAKPVFINERDIFGSQKPQKEQWLTDIDLHGILGRVIPHEQIRGLRWITNGLWRINTDTTEAQESLLYEGNVTIREKMRYLFMGSIPGAWGIIMSTLSKFESSMCRSKPMIAKITKVITLKWCTVSNLYRQRLRLSWWSAAKICNCDFKICVYIKPSLMYRLSDHKWFNILCDRFDKFKILRIGDEHVNFRMFQSTP